MFSMCKSQFDSEAIRRRWGVRACCRSRLQWEEALGVRARSELCASRPQWEEAHRALVRLLTRVPAHVDNQHVLRLEGLLLPRAGLPAAHKLLLLPVNVLIVDMLLGGETRGGGQFKGHLPGPAPQRAWLTLYSAGPTQSAEALLPQWTVTRPKAST